MPSMHGARIRNINILEAPIRPAPCPLMEVVKEHLGYHLDASYSESHGPTAGDDSGDNNRVSCSNKSPTECLYNTTSSICVSCTGYVFCHVWRSNPSWITSPTARL